MVMTSSQARNNLILDVINLSRYGTLDYGVNDIEDLSGDN